MFNYTYCKCNIPLASDGTCRYEQSTCSDGNAVDCYGNGRCVELPGKTEKSCLCKITHAGQFCETRRSCQYAYNDWQKPCLNNGTCDDSNDDHFLYKCKCASGFYGDYCENVHPCHPFKNRFQSIEECERMYDV